MKHSHSLWFGNVVAGGQNEPQQHENAMATLTYSSFVSTCRVLKSRLVLTCLGLLGIGWPCRVSPGLVFSCFALPCLVCLVWFRSVGLSCICIPLSTAPLVSAHAQNITDRSEKHGEFDRSPAGHCWSFGGVHLCASRDKQHRELPK